MEIEAAQSYKNCYFFNEMAILTPLILLYPSLVHILVIVYQDFQMKISKLKILLNLKVQQLCNFCAASRMTFLVIATYKLICWIF